MLEEQVSNDEPTKPQISISLKICLVLCTLIYLLLFPFLLFWVLLYGLMTFDLSGVIPMLASLTMLLLMFCFPLSLGVSIYLIITGYGREARELRFACALPLIAFAAVSIVERTLQTIFWR